LIAAKPPKRNKNARSKRGFHSLLPSAWYGDWHDGVDADHLSEEIAVRTAGDLVD
jgi:hypothetical protein